MTFFKNIIYFLLIINYCKARIHLNNEGISITYVNQETLAFVHAHNETSANGERTFSVEFKIKDDLDPKNLELSVKPSLVRPNGKLRPTPLTITQNICEAFAKNSLGMRNVFDKSNVTDCPIKKGYYYINKYVPDETKMPNIPFGRYQVEFMFINKRKNLCGFNWIGSIQKP